MVKWRRRTWRKRNRQGRRTWRTAKNNKKWKTSETASLAQRLCVIAQLPNISFIDISGGLRCVPLWKIQHGGRPATPRCDPRPAATDMHASRSGRSAALRCMQQIMRFDSCFLPFEASSIFVLRCWTWCCGEASLQRESLPKLQMDGYQ